MSEENNVVEVPQLPDFDELFKNLPQEQDESTKQKNIQECMSQINESLNKYDCALAPEAAFVVDQEGYLRFTSNLRIVPRPPAGSMPAQQNIPVMPNTEL